MKIPLLDYVAEKYSDVDFTNILVVAVQHILETNFALFEKLFEKGLKPENTFLLGKCYSSNVETIKKFQERGVFVSSESTKFDNERSFDDLFDSLIETFLNSVINKKDWNSFEKIILVDDGGHLIAIANKLLKNFEKVVAIEQTSSGFNRLEKKELKFPIINLARSEAKLTHESPHIAEKIISELFTKIKRLDIHPKNALIIGGGPIGKSIKAKLNQILPTKIFDLDNKNSDFKESDLQTIVKDYDLVIGATGNEIKKLPFKKNTILVSASSSDREFSNVNLRDPNVKNCHSDIFTNGVWLLNCGFPLNFNGKKHSVDPEKIQLTRALMFAGICIARSTNYSPKWLELDNSIQEQIVRKYLEETKWAILFDHEDHEIEMEGIKLLIKDKVFTPNPKITYSTTQIIKHLPELKDKEVLDLGCGTGVLGIYCLKKGAKVLLADNEDRAIENTKINLEKNNLKAEVIKSNLFEKIDRKFDYILANLPILNEVWDSETSSITERFLKEYKNHIKPNGKVYFSWASFADLEPVKKSVPKCEIIEEKALGFNWFLLLFD
jgi:2-polyprenyl-3-methyl-5-hydroxy-6-metoxy-1,4-benzoquinol methylase